MSTPHSSNSNISKVIFCPVSLKLYLTSGRMVTLQNLEKMEVMKNPIPAVLTVSRLARTLFKNLTINIEVEAVLRIVLDKD